MKTLNSVLLALVAFASNATLSSITANAGLIGPPQTIRDFMKERGVDTTANYALDSIITRPKVSWRRADLPFPLRSRVHLVASLVPPFPHDDPKLMDPRNWPPSMIIEGMPCSLTVNYVYRDLHSRWSRSFDDSGGAIVLATYYTKAGIDYHSYNARNFGPRYDWNRGRLTQRHWTKGKDSHSRIRSYWPYPSGELFRLEEVDMRYDAKGDYESIEKLFDEAFARDGTLIGCAVKSKGKFLGYWMGVDVGGVYNYRCAEVLERTLARP